MRLGQTSVIYLTSKIVASFIGFLATIYFTRFLGEEIYGFYALTLAIVSWLGIVKSIGFGQAIIKRMSEDEEPDAYLAAGAIFKATLTLLVAGVVFVLRDQVNEYVGVDVAEFVVLLLVVSIFSGLVSNALKGTHRVHIYAPLTTSREAIRSIVMVGFVYIGWELAGMLLGYAIGTLLLAVVGLYIIKPKPVLPKVAHVRRLFDFAKWSWLGSMRSKSFNDVDIVLLGFFVSAGLIGVYAVAWSLSKFLDIFTDAISNTLFPEMSKLAVAGRDEMVATLTEDSLAFAGVFLIPGFVGATILGEYLMRIYGPGFAIGEEVLWLLVAAILLYAYARQLLNTLNAIDRPDLAFRANAVFIAANIVLNLTLIYLFDWVGAAVATALSAAIGLLMAYRYAAVHVGFSIPTGEILRQWIAAGIMGLVVLGSLQLPVVLDMLEWNIATVIIPVGVGGAIYFAIYLGISRRFRTTVDDNLPFGLPLVSR